MTTQSKIRAEIVFFDTLKKRFPIIPQYRQVDPRCLDKCVDRDKLVDWLEADKLLPATRRNRCIEVLRGCPSQLKVALEPSRISFDFVVMQDGQPYYWEFHERQHRELKKDRPWREIYRDDGSPLKVPRYLQRLVRDVWRVLYFRPYTIVWFDWFAANQASYLPSLQTGLNEFHIRDGFSFQKFCQTSEGDMSGNHPIRLHRQESMP